MRNKRNDEKEKRKLAACIACGAQIYVLRNYPPIDLPRVLELWCESCKTISLYANPDHPGKLAV